MLQFSYTNCLCIKINKSICVLRIFYRMCYPKNVLNLFTILLHLFKYVYIDLKNSEFEYLIFT